VAATAKTTALRPLLVAALYVASRLPLLLVGFGSDADAWSVAANAPDLVLHGRYHPSRFPGHPLHEGLYSLAIVAGGPLTANVLSLLLSAAVLALVWWSARRLDSATPAWLVLALAVQPLFWITSADSTDFMLAALLGLAGLLLAEEDHATAAGVAIGLATATRIESAAFVVPALVLLRHARLRSASVFALVALVCYLPVLRLGAGAGDPADILVPHLSVWAHVVTFATALWAATGLVPGLVLIGLLAASVPRARAVLAARDPMAWSALWLIAAYGAATLVHPTKPTYYLPILPVCLLALGRCAAPRWQAALALAFLSYAFVYPDVVDRKQGRLVFGFRWNNGLVVKDWIARWDAAGAAASIDRNRPRPAVVVLAYWLPMWKVDHPEARAVDALASGLPLDPRTNEARVDHDGSLLCHKLDRASAERLGSTRQLAFGEGVDEFMLQTYGYDLKQLGATAVRVTELGPQVAERFSFPTLMACSLRRGPFVPCVQGESAHALARFGPRS
jgi:hypothetical protein